MISKDVYRRGYAQTSEFVAPSCVLHNICAVDVPFGVCLFSFLVFACLFVALVCLFLWLLCLFV